jgi:mRNA interferase MazF
MVIRSMYVPDKGDIVWLEFSPQAGHEQSGRRPALVLSPKTYNDQVGLALFCPVTSQVKGYPFEVNLPKKSGVSGAILSDHIKSLDWRVRNVELITSVSKEILEEVLAKVLTILGSKTSS